MKVRLQVLHDAQVDDTDPRQCHAGPGGCPHLMVAAPPGGVGAVTCRLFGKLWTREGERLRADACLAAAGAAHDDAPAPVITTEPPAAYTFGVRRCTAVATSAGQLLSAASAAVRCEREPGHTGHHKHGAWGWRGDGPYAPGDPRNEAVLRADLAAALALRAAEVRDLHRRLTREEDMVSRLRLVVDAGRRAMRASDADAWPEFRAALAQLDGEAARPMGSDGGA